MAPRRLGPETVRTPGRTTQPASNEDRHLERQRYPGARRPGLGVDGARAARRGVPAGTESGVAQIPEAVQRRTIMRSGTAARAIRECRCNREGDVPRRSGLQPPHSTWSRASCRRKFGELVIASVYVPNGGKDYPAKLISCAAGGMGETATGRKGARCALRRHEHRSHRNGRASEGAETRIIGQRPEERALVRDPPWHAAWWMSAAPSTPTTRTCSRGGHPGATCASAISAGDSTTSSLHRRWRPREPRAASCRPTSAPATMRRW